MAIRPITLSPEQRTNLKPLGGVSQMGAGGTSQMGGLSQLTGMGEMSPLQKILGMGVMSGKVKPTTVSALSSLGFLPQKDTQTKKRVMDIEGGLSSLSQARQEIQEAKKLVTTGKDVSGGLGKWGPIMSLRKTLGIFPSPGESTKQLEARLSNINEKLFEVAGKALTGTEVEVLAGKIPKVSYKEDVLSTMLNELEQNLIRKQQGLIQEYGQY